MTELGAQCYVVACCFLCVTNLLLFHHFSNAYWLRLLSITNATLTTYGRAFNEEDRREWNSSPLELNPERGAESSRDSVSRYDGVISEFPRLFHIPV